MTDQKRPAPGITAVPGPVVRPLTCPACGGQAERGPAYEIDRRITCFFCGYEGPEATPTPAAKRP